MKGSNSGNASPAKGVAVVTFDCTTSVMEYVVIHNIEDPISGLVFISGGETQSSVLFSLSG